MRRPAAGRRRFVSGTTRTDTVEAFLITEADGRLPFRGQTRPGSIYDRTRVRRLLKALTGGVAT